MEAREINIQYPSVYYMYVWHMHCPLLRNTLLIDDHVYVCMYKVDEVLSFLNCLYDMQLAISNFSTRISRLFIV